MLQQINRKILFKEATNQITMTRGIVRIPQWDYHIRMDPRFGRKRPCQDVLDRFKRLNNGMWIHAKPGRAHLQYRKDEHIRKLNQQWETCTREECAMLDTMMTPYCLRAKHYVNDPFEPFHTRYGINSPRVDAKKRLVRERPKILLDDLTADRFFDRIAPEKTKASLLIQESKSELPKVLKKANKQMLLLLNKN